MAAAAPSVAQVHQEPGTYVVMKGQNTGLAESAAVPGGGGGGASGTVVKFGAGRIAYSADGNHHDRDDIGATPMGLLILHIANLKGRLVHYEYSNHLGANTASQARDMEDSALGAQARYGYPRGIFHDAQTEAAAAQANLVAEINKSTAADPLYIVGAGPMETIWRAMNASNQGARQHVRCISHSNWNNNHEDTSQLNHTWADIGNLPGGHVMDKITDQNGSGGSSSGGDMNTAYSEWTWMRDSDDPQVRYCWDRMKEAFGSKADPSDAGMLWYVVSGLTDENANSAKIRDLYDHPPGPAGPDVDAGPDVTDYFDPAGPWSDVSPAVTLSGADLPMPPAEAWFYRLRLAD